MYIYFLPVYITFYIQVVIYELTSILLPPLSGVSDLASTHPTALCDALRSYARFGGESDRTSAHYPDIRHLRALFYCR